jgi:L-aminopeptidase/D-esterase-like protein
VTRRLDAITDVAGLRVGHWTDRRAATGCTVVICPPGTVGGVDVRGGAPGTRETDLLRPGNLVEEVSAVLLTGGSAFGLDAASGVVRWCEEQGMGLQFGGFCIPIVPAAVLFDLGLGRADVRPDAASGYAAAASAKTGRVQRGTVGAGTGATVAKLLGREHALKGGIGTASEATNDGLVVAALVAVNAAGDIYDSSGSVIAAPRSENGGFADSIAALRGVATTPTPGENTTIGIMATNARLTKAQASRLATVAHDGIARAVRPAHTLADGDTLFALATGEREVSLAGLRAIEALAPLAVERAIVDAVVSATSLAGVPSVSAWR